MADKEFSLEDGFDMLSEDEDSKINLQGNNVASILGLTQERDQSKEQSIKHYEVDLDMYDDLFNSSVVMQSSVQDGMDILPVFDKLNKDMFLSLFKYQPEIYSEAKMKQSTRINNRVMRKLAETDEFKSLRRHCKLDLYNAALGTEIVGNKAVDIINQWKEEAMKRYEERQAKKGKKGKNPLDVMDDLVKLEDEIDDLLANQQAAQDMLDKMKAMGKVPNANFQAAMDDLQMKLDEAQALAALANVEMDDFLDSGDDLLVELVTKLTGAFSEADMEVAEDSDIIEQWGLTDGDGCRIPFEEKKLAVEAIRKSVKLKDLTDLIGKFKTSAIATQKKKTKDGGNSIKSIKNGNVIERVLPSEKLMLCNDVTKKDFYRKFNQKELLQYELDSNKRQSKGPIIVCDDTSGSMQGTKEKWSKAVTIAMLEIAHLQKRDFACIIFDTIAEEPIIIEKGKVEPLSVVKIAEDFLDGGTNFQKPLEKALKLINQSRFSKADIVFITDGESQISDEFKKKFNETKENKDFKVMSICINAGEHGRVNTKSLQAFSDEIIMLSDLADLEDENSEIAQYMFSSI